VSIYHTLVAVATFAALPSDPGGEFAAGVLHWTATPPGTPCHHARHVGPIHLTLHIGTKSKEMIRRELQHCMRGGESRGGRCGEARVGLLGEGMLSSSGGRLRRIGQGRLGAGRNMEGKLGEECALVHAVRSMHAMGGCGSAPTTPRIQASSHNSLQHRSGFPS